MRYRIRQIAAGFSLLLMFSTGYSAQIDKAPALRIFDLEGRSLQLDSYLGKVVLVNFWATWCIPCRTEIPDLIKWQREYRRHLQVVGITYPPETITEVRRFVYRRKVNYPVALGTRETKLLFTKSDTLPMTAVIDAEGNLREIIEGIVFPEEFDQKIKVLLRNDARNPTTISRVSRRLSPTLQKATIIVGSEGYRPTNVRLRRGIPARLTFIRKVAEGCGTEIVIPAYEIHRALPLNVPVVVSFTPKKTGRFKLTCGMDMFRGALIVE